MRKVLYVNCIMREGSRTKELADAFFSKLKDAEVCELILRNEDLKPLVNDFFESRQKLLEENNRTHVRFRYAHQFKEADMIVIAAPFWDLSFPALLKIYIENVSVDGITFLSTSDGLKGNCAATDLVYLTTRGGFYNGDPMEMALPQFEALSRFFGIDRFHSIAADGMNVQGFDSDASLNEAKEEAEKLAETL